MIDVNHHHANNGMARSCKDSVFFLLVQCNEQSERISHGYQIKEEESSTATRVHALLIQYKFDELLHFK